MPAELEFTTLTNHLRRQGRLVAQTVHECGECGERYLGERRCPDCGCFLRRLGVGGAARSATTRCWSSSCSRRTNDEGS